MTLRALAGRLLRPHDFLNREAAGFLLSCFPGSIWQIGAYVSLSATQSLLVLPALWLLTYTIDTAIPQKRPDLLAWACAGIIAVRVITGLTAVGLRSWVLRMVTGTIRNMRTDLIARLYAMDRDAPAFAEPDQIQNRIIADTERVNAMFGSLVSNTLPAVVTSLSLTLYMAHTDLRLLGLGVVAGLVFWQVNRWTVRSTRSGVDTFRRAHEKFSNGVRFVLRHMDLTRLRDAETDEIARQRAHVAHLGRATEAMAMTFAWHAQVRTVGTGIIGGLIIGLGGLAIIAGTLSLGQLMAFTTAASILGNHLRRTLDTLPEMVVGTASLTALQTLRAAGPERTYRGTRPFEWAGPLELADVVGRYRDRTVLDGVSLRLDRDSRELLVGRNGAGKTTLLNVLLGFIRPESGRVTADGLLYDEIDLGCLRRRIGVLQQHPDFFAGTVRENLLYGLDHRTGDEIDDALARAQADFVATLPLGLETVLRDGGKDLSGGERQRLTIARTLLGRPLLLVLDEPTNHLDIEAIGRLMHGLSTLPSAPAVIMVSHDPALAAFADQVFGLANGHLAEETPAPAARVQAGGQGT